MTPHTPSRELALSGSALRLLPAASGPGPPDEVFAAHGDTEECFAFDVSDSDEVR